MRPDRMNTICVLIDLQYHSSMNSFEELYGDHVSYQELEQSSYIEFKEHLFTRINENIKFRKYGRIGNVLTIKADMLKVEIDKFKKILDKNEIKLVHCWVVSNVTIITDKMLNAQSQDLEDGGSDDIEEDFEEDF